MLDDEEQMTHPAFTIASYENLDDVQLANTPTSREVTIKLTNKQWVSSWPCCNTALHLGVALQHQAHNAFTTLL